MNLDNSEHSGKKLIVTAAPICDVVAWTFCVLCGLVLSGCHWDMWDDARLKPFEKSALFMDGNSSRGLVPGTVPYHSPRLDAHFAKGQVDGEYAVNLPDGITLDRALLERGQERFTIYCTPCHSALGDGQGMVVKRGFPPPPSYHIDRLREAPIGYFFDVMTNGFGRMYSYATRVPPEDRWAIAAYIRALQLSQGATPELLPVNILELAKNPPEPAAEEDEAPSEH